RALTAWPLLLFGLVEQIVHLLITIAMGITFVSFGVAILFAFFKRTESIAHSIINQDTSQFLTGIIALEKFKQVIVQTCSQRILLKLADGAQYDIGCDDCLFARSRHQMPEAIAPQMVERQRQITHATFWRHHWTD